MNFVDIRGIPNFFQIPQGSDLRGAERNPTEFQHSVGSREIRGGSVGFHGIPRNSFESNGVRGIPWKPFGFHSSVGFCGIPRNPPEFLEFRGVPRNFRTLRNSTGLQCNSAGYVGGRENGRERGSGSGALGRGNYCLSIVCFKVFLPFRGVRGRAWERAQTR